MKVTIEIPDELVRRVKAKAALEGRAIREVTAELYQLWLSEAGTPADAPSPEQWMEEWFTLADAAMSAAPPGPTARDLLEEGRARLERR